jgi:hypothetical protein
MNCWSGRWLRCESSHELARLPSQRADLVLLKTNPLESIDAVRTPSLVINASNFMLLRKAGVSLSQFQDRVRAGENPNSLSDGVVGALMVPPGVTAVGALLVGLLPGRTDAMFCNLQDGADKPPHSALGMVASRTIPAPR